jgi:hypothetical protein
MKIAADFLFLVALSFNLKSKYMLGRSMIREAVFRASNIPSALPE